MIFVPKWKDRYGTVYGTATRHESATLAAMGHVNRGPQHMPAGSADHLEHLRRLAMRGERDES